MTPARTFTLINQDVRNRALGAVHVAPVGHVVRIAEETRTEAQNRMLHPIIREATDNFELVYKGQTMTDNEWRRFFVLCVKVAAGEVVKLVPSPEGTGIFDVTESSSRVLSKRAFSELIDYVIWFSDAHGKPVTLKARKDAYDSPDYITADKRQIKKAG